MICFYDTSLIPRIHNMTNPEPITPENAKLGTWWLHTPSKTVYQLRSLPQPTPNLNNPKPRVLWHRDRKTTIPLPLEIPSDFEYLGSGHNPPSLSEVKE